MDIFDLINTLRKGTPDVKKARLAVFILGAICLLIALWNFFILNFVPLDKSPLKNIPKHARYIIFACFTTLSLFFFLSAKGIKEQRLWGKRLVQISIFLMVAAFSLLMIAIFDHIGLTKSISSSNGISIFMTIFLVVFFLQFIIPGYFAILYFGRLPVADETMTEAKIEFERLMSEKPSTPKPATTTMIYRESPSPFGLHITFFLLMFIAVTIGFATATIAGTATVPFIMPVLFFLLFAGPIAYNAIPSSFQKSRTLLLARLGGCSIFFFNASWPFCRILLYEDGIEIRIMLQRYFIPYDKILDLPEKPSFFFRGIQIKSDLSGVPSGIRFFVFGMKNFTDKLHELRNNYISGRQTSLQP